jgi:transketolase
VALALTRQKLPVLDCTELADADKVAQGGYVLADAEGERPDIILIATGSEVHLALEAREQLVEQSVEARVVSMPSWELFDQQHQTYRDQVLPPTVTTRLAIEAGVPQGWHRYVGLAGEVIGLNRFGASAPYKTLMEKFGFTAENIASRALALLGR